MGQLARIKERDFIVSVSDSIRRTQVQAREVCRSQTLKIPISPKINDLRFSTPQNP